MKNRWLILLAGIVIQTILGGIYAWSIFVPTLIENHGLSKGQCGTIFGLCIAVFTLAMIGGGRVLVSKGPRVTSVIGAVLFIVGYLLAAMSGGSYPLLLLGISLFSGAGIGFGYVCPLTVGMKWFPKSKGLIAGVTVAGFGGGAIVLSSVAAYYLDAGMDVLRFFMWLGIVPGALLLAASLLLDVPSRTQQTAPTGSVRQEVMTLPFLLCTLGMFVGTFSGLLVIGNLSPIVLDAGLSVELAATAVSVFAVGNAVGRILWGILFDRIAYKTIPASLGVFAGTLLTLSVASHPWLILFCAGLLGFGFGANFVIYASAISRYFDGALFPRLYPICFLGYGLAGVTGPAIGGYIADATGAYDPALFLSITMMAATTILMISGLRSFANGQVPDAPSMVVAGD
ncbi:MAG: MFS transporter [Candidatus Pacebacteria bacterium]|nr:MFS transporter [Candidatus Paceibacterota bacterium]